uniref:Glycerophosphodiester phosphodiesterase domain containing 5 n=1 Tax=Sinocyclocheilus grahami TaxID=75366 RepID=A0A672RAM8_SINGR
MVKHQPLQVYERQLCLSCLTGIYGCRWKRYQRSHDDTTKVINLKWSILLFLYNRSGEWSDGTVPILAATAAGFTYIAFLMILALCHAAVGQQLNLHWLHKIGVTAALLTTIISVISVTQMWGEEWDVVWISLQATGPFLHIGALAAVTALAWLMAGQVARAEKTRFQLMVLLVYLSVLLTLYFIPLSITSPCIMERGSLKAAPTIIGHHGAPMLAPENSLLSFNRALQRNVSGLEADVTISLDGVPFLMRDRTLRRTTNVRRVFPERQYDDASLFNWTDLSSLNAGQWFLKDDPFWTVQYMSMSERWSVGNQTVCSLEQMLKLAARSKSSALFTLRRPPPNHPHHHDWVNLTLDTVLRAGIPQWQVMWTVDSNREMVRKAAPGLQQTSVQKLPLDTLHHKGISRVLLRYNQASAQDIRLYNENNISLTLHSVNKPWLYSLLWCSGVPSVSSEAPQVLRKVHYPLWLMVRTMAQSHHSFPRYVIGQHLLLWPLFKMKSILPLFKKKILEYFIINGKKKRSSNGCNIYSLAPPSGVFASLAFVSFF